ncbi:MAG: restriction endonuclease subunit S [Epsilonproteobacteria bacterium]|nr:restriction endonuclease subunit S [Campylobacterota bacterium]
MGEIGEFKTSSIDKIINKNEKLVNLVNYMDVYRNKHIDKNFKCSETSLKEEQYEKANLKKGDILFTPSSETPDDIGHSAVITEDLTNTVYSYHLVRFRPKKKIDINFSGYVFNNVDILKEFARKATGSTRFTLSIKDFNEIRAKLPSLPEQQKIAEVLSLADKEINLLKNSLEELKLQKKALMQKLLTGEVRVKV